MSNYRITVNGTSKEVTLLEKDHTRVVFLLDGVRHEVDITPTFTPPTSQPSRTSVSTTSSQPAAPAAQGGDITAPMPGVIVSVDVSKGDNVSAGQRVCVMEAMKMENNITASSGGVVKEVLVKAGEEVQNHQVLIRIE